MGIGFRVMKGMLGVKTIAHLDDTSRRQRELHRS